MAEVDHLARLERLLPPDSQWRATFSLKSTGSSCGRPEVGRALDGGER